MKKNKAFTLAELLIIIVIVGLLISLTGYTVSRVLRGTKENIKEQELKSLLDAGKNYINEVIDGKDTYVFSDGEFKGSLFLGNIVTKCSSYSECNLTKEDNVNSVNSYTIPVSLTSLKDYVDLDRYVEDKCGITAYIDIRIVRKGNQTYYTLEGLDVKANSSTKAKTCVTNN